MNMRLIGIFTLGGLIAIGIEFIRRARFVPIHPTRLVDTRPGE